jgi:hypothetical protein
MGQDLLYGIVKVVRGKHRGRIGLYDEDDDENPKRAVVYFGDMICVPGDLLPISSLVPVTTSDLIARRDDILSQIATFPGLADSKKVLLLAELELTSEELYGRLANARETSRRTLFISHSSLDKKFAKWLAIDLSNAGHSAWLDEWEIRVGDSIPSKISEGLNGCDVMVIVLSEHSVKSQWVENEWQAKYWQEIQERRTLVLPALLRSCEIPILLRAKKYADFSKDYNFGLGEILDALADRPSRG